MRYELSDYEWCLINPMLPNKPRLATNYPFARCASSFFNPQNR